MNDDESSEIDVEVVGPEIEMVRALTEFLVHLCPDFGEDGEKDPYGQAMAPIVREAHDLALVAAFRRIGRIASEVEPELQFPFHSGPTR